MEALEPDIYVYKMIADNGGAPCVYKNLLSLALCKPIIRKTAEKDSLVFGFGGKEYDERLIYIARVTKKLENDNYYRRRAYARRPDCIYKVENNRPVRKASAKYHTKSDGRKKDVGFNFEKAFVLLSEDFRYLGRKGTDDYKKRYPKIKSLIEDLTQGHRRYHSVKLRKELMALKTEAWRRYRRKRVGLPTENDRSRPCNQDSPSAHC
jgi:hypothetical protein